LLISREDITSLGFILPSDHNSDVVQMKRGKGCRQCRHTGYLGREGVFEVLSITDDIKKLIIQKESAEAIKKTAHKEGMKLLKENVTVTVLKGRTTYKEAQRCISQEE
jgi:type II secretory ATPase GspE/PulE/Tfp pilus assembly ATPase PilB-like protein